MRGTQKKESGWKHDTPLSKDVTTTSLLLDIYHEFMMILTAIIGDKKIVGLKCYFLGQGIL